MDNQHKKIIGYRDLSQQEIDLMNAIKEKGRELEGLCAEVQLWNSGEGALYTNTPEDISFNDLVVGAEAPRFASIAKTHFQEGLMALTRAVAKPTDFF